MKMKDFCPSKGTGQAWRGQQVSGRETCSTRTTGSWHQAHTYTLTREGGTANRTGTRNRCLTSRTSRYGGKQWSPRLESGKCKLR